MAPLALVPNLTTRWHHLHYLQIWPPDGATCISSKFGHQMAPPALVTNLLTSFSHLHCIPGSDKNFQQYIIIIIRGILVILVMLQVWLEKNWKQWSVCFGCIFDMGLHWLKWEKKWASLKNISTLIFGKMFDFFVPRRSWQFPVKSDAKASISFARPWNSP